MNKTLNYKNNEFEIVISIRDKKISITGIITDNYKNKIKEINYTAADPPEERYSFSGTGMPFHNFNQAITKGINKGNVPVVNNKFNFELELPNSYYETLGTVYKGSTIFIKTCETDKYEEICLDSNIPFRFLNHPAINSYKSVTEKMYKPSSPFFYNLDLPQRSQQQILIDSAYSCTEKMPDNFWGLKPSL